MFWYILLVSECNLCTCSLIVWTDQCRYKTKRKRVKTHLKSTYNGDVDWWGICYTIDKVRFSFLFNKRIIHFVHWQNFLCCFCLFIMIFFVHFTFFISLACIIVLINTIAFTGKTYINVRTFKMISLSRNNCMRIECFAQSDVINERVCLYFLPHDSIYSFGS